MKKISIAAVNSLILGVVGLAVSGLDLFLYFLAYNRHFFFGEDLSDLEYRLFILCVLAWWASSGVLFLLLMLLDGAILNRVKIIDNEFRYGSMLAGSVIFALLSIYVFPYIYELDIMFPYLPSSESAASVSCGVFTIASIVGAGLCGLICLVNILVIEGRKRKAVKVENVDSKPRVKLYENWFVLCVITFVLLFAGEFIGAFLVETPVLFLGMAIAAYQGTTIQGLVQDAQTDMDIISALPIPDWLQTSVMYASFIGIWIMFLIMFFVKLYKPIRKALWTKTKGNTVGNFMIGLLLGFVMNGICILAAYLHGDIKLTFDSVRPISLVFVFICVLIQSSAEELVCRGFLYQMLVKNYKPWVAILVNSCFFGSLHLMNPGVSVMAIVDIVVCGILFSLMVYYMDSIWAAMAVHTSWNFCQNIIFGLLNSGQSTPYSIFKLDNASARNSFAYNVDFGVESTPLAIGIQVVVAVMIFVWGYLKKKKPTDIWAEEVQVVPDTETISEKG